MQLTQAAVTQSNMPFIKLIAIRAEVLTSWWEGVWPLGDT